MEHTLELVTCIEFNNESCKAFHGIHIGTCYMHGVEECMISEKWSGWALHGTMPETYIHGVARHVLEHTLERVTCMDWDNEM